MKTLLILVLVTLHLVCIGQDFEISFGNWSNVDVSQIKGPSSLQQVSFESTRMIVEDNFAANLVDDYKPLEVVIDRIYDPVTKSLWIGEKCDEYISLKGHIHGIKLNNGNLSLLSPVSQNPVALESVQVVTETFFEVLKNEILSANISHTGKTVNLMNTTSKKHWVVGTIRHRYSAGRLHVPENQINNKLSITSVNVNNETIKVQILRDSQPISVRLNHNWIVDSINIDGDECVIYCENEFSLKDEWQTGSVELYAVPIINNVKGKIDGYEVVDSISLGQSNLFNNKHTVIISNEHSVACVVPNGFHVLFSGTKFYQFHLDRTGTLYMSSKNYEFKNEKQIHVLISKMLKDVVNSVSHERMPDGFVTSDISKYIRPNVKIELANNSNPYVYNNSNFSPINNQDVDLFGYLVNLKDWVDFRIGINLEECVVNSVIIKQGDSSITAK